MENRDPKLSPGESREEVARTCKKWLFDVELPPKWQGLDVKPDARPWPTRTPAYQLKHFLENQYFGRLSHTEPDQKKQEFVGNELMYEFVSKWTDIELSDGGADGGAESRGSADMSFYRTLKEMLEEQLGEHKERLSLDVVPAPEFPDETYGGVNLADWYEDRSVRPRQHVCIAR